MCQLNDSGPAPRLRDSGPTVNLEKYPIKIHYATTDEPEHECQHPAE